MGNHFVIGDLLFLIKRRVVHVRIYNIWLLFIIINLKFDISITSLTKSCVPTNAPKHSNRQSSTISQFSSFQNRRSYPTTYPISRFSRNPLGTLLSPSYPPPLFPARKTPRNSYSAETFSYIPIFRASVRVSWTWADRSLISLGDRILWKQTFASINIVEGVACPVERGWKELSALPNQPAPREKSRLG